MKDLKEETQQNLQIEMTGIEIESELRAYIYQQLNELSPFLLPKTQASLTVHFTDQKQFLARLLLKTEEGEIQAIGLSENEYDALSSAKEEMLKKLTAIQDMIVSNRERDLEISERLRLGQLH